MRPKEKNTKHGGKAKKKMKKRPPMKEEHKIQRSLSGIKYWDNHREPRLQKNGYLTLVIGNHKKYLHRIIMEQYLGRPLDVNESVHHINGNKLDNRIENLQLMSKQEHCRLHAIQRGFGHKTN